MVKPSKRIGPRYEEKGDAFSRAAAEAKKNADVYSKHKSGRSTMRSDQMNVARKGRKETV